MIYDCPFSWAQRSDRLLITINLADIQNYFINTTETSLTFSCNSGYKTYKSSINLYDSVDIKSSKINILGIASLLVISKKNKNAEYWPRLTKEGDKHQNISVDWTNYIDPDDEKEEGSENYQQDWDTSTMEGLNGMPGMGGMPRMNGFD